MGPLEAKRISLLRMVGLVRMNVSHNSQLGECVARTNPL